MFEYILKGRLKLSIQFCVEAMIEVCLEHALQSIHPE